MPYGLRRYAPLCGGRGARGGGSGAKTLSAESESVADSVLHVKAARSAAVHSAGSGGRLACLASLVVSSEYEKALDLVREGELLNGARGGNAFARSGCAEL